MAKEVTCQICKMKIPKEIAFVAKTESGRNKYYCSEKEYNDHIKDMKYKDLVTNIISKMLNGISDYSVLTLERKEWMASNKVIYEYLIQNEQNIQKCIDNRDKKDSFRDDRCKILYISKIIKSEIEYFKAGRISSDEVVKQRDFEFYTPVCKAKKRRKCIQDYINDYGGDKNE